MAKALDLITDFEYQSERDTDEKKTTWYLRSLTGTELLRATRRGFVDDQMILELGITGWDDFIDQDDKPMEYHKSRIPLIPPMIAQDLSFKIQNLASMGDEERKNS